MRLWNKLALLPLFAIPACAASVDSDAPTFPGPNDENVESSSAALTAGPSTTDNYIVMYKPGIASVQTATEDSLQRAGGKMKRRFSSAFNGFAANLPAAAVQQLRNNPNVALVEPDGIARAIATETQTLTTSQWGLDRVDVRTRAFDQRYSYENNGAGVDVFIVDTGIRYDHQEFGGRAQSYWDYVDGDAMAEDGNGHGTHVAGTVGGATVGIAKGVNLWGMRVLGNDGSGTYSGIIAAVDELTRLKQANPSRRIVGNMSLGGGVSSALNTAVNNSVAAGVVWAVAAGNENVSACNSSPASAASAITVGATTSTDARSSFSNYGSCVDVFAPGSGIYSSTNGGTNTYASWNGTSMASPHVAGAAALYLSANPSATASSVISWITNNATTGLVTSAGTGSPNRLLHTLNTVATQPPAPSAVLRIADLDGARTVARRNWSASVTTEVRNTDGSLASGASVNLSWSGASKGSGRCTTGTNGRCTFSVSGLSNNRTLITFNVTNVTKSGFTYNAALNSDPDTDSNGTSITVTR